MGPLEKAASRPRADAPLPFRISGGEPHLRDVYPVLVQPPSAGSSSGWIGRYAAPEPRVRFDLSSALLKEGSASLEGALPEKALVARDLPRRWARARVDHLLALIEAEGEKREWVDEIIALSKRYKFVTPYTAFLAAPRSLLRPRRIQPGRSRAARRVRSRHRLGRRPSSPSACGCPWCAGPGTPRLGGALPRARRAGGRPLHGARSCLRDAAGARLTEIEALRARRARAPMIRPSPARGPARGAAARRRARRRGRDPAPGPPRRRRAGAAPLGRRQQALGGTSSASPPRSWGRKPSSSRRWTRPRTAASPEARSGGAALRRARHLALLASLALAGLGASSYVPWEDLTEADWLYTLATRFGTVEGHRVHYPTPTAELAQALEGRTEAAACVIWPRPAWSWAIARAPTPCASSGGPRPKVPVAWAEDGALGRRPRRHGARLPRGGQSAARPPRRRATRGFCDEQVAWADAHPDAADRVALRETRAAALPGRQRGRRGLDPRPRRRGPACRRGRRGPGRDRPERRAPPAAAVRPSGRPRRQEAGASSCSTRRSSLRPPGRRSSEKPSWSGRTAGAPGAPEALAGQRSTRRSTPPALLRLTSYFEGQGRGDAAADLLTQVERRYERALGRTELLLLARLHGEIDAVPEAFRDLLSAAQLGTPAQQNDDLAGLVRLALLAGGRPLAVGVYNDEPYRWIARIDRTPGFWTGGLSFLLTGQDWKEALARLEAESLPERTFATARALLAELVRRAPQSPGDARTLLVRVMARHVERGEGTRSPRPPARPGSGSARRRGRGTPTRAPGRAPDRGPACPRSSASRRHGCASLAANGSRPRLSTEGSEPASPVPEPGPRLAAPGRVPIPRDLQGSPREHDRAPRPARPEPPRGDRPHAGRARPPARGRRPLVRSGQPARDLEPRRRSGTALRAGARAVPGRGLVGARGPLVRAPVSPARSATAWPTELASRFRGAAHLREGRGCAAVRFELPDSPRPETACGWSPGPTGCGCKRPRALPPQPAGLPRGPGPPASHAATGRSAAPAAARSRGRPLGGGRGRAARRAPLGRCSSRTPTAVDEFFAEAMRKGDLETRLLALESAPLRTPVDELLLFEGGAGSPSSRRPRRPRTAWPRPIPATEAWRGACSRCTARWPPSSRARGPRATALVARTAPALDDPSPLFTELGEMEIEAGQPAEAARRSGAGSSSASREAPSASSSSPPCSGTTTSMKEALGVLEEGRSGSARPAPLRVRGGRPARGAARHPGRGPRVPERAHFRTTRRRASAPGSSAISARCVAWPSSWAASAWRASSGRRSSASGRA